MAEVKCHGCNQMVLLYQGVCTECETVVVAVADGHVLYCRAPECNRTLKTTQRLCDRCGTDQSTGKAASSKTLSQKNRDRADKWKCTLGLDRCLEAYKEAWNFGKTLTPNDIAECVWLVRNENVRADEQTEKNRKAAILVETTNASGNKVMVPGGSPRYKAGTKEVMITLPNYASLESDFRTVVLQQKWRGAENGAKKRERTEARERDEKKDVREIYGTFLFYKCGDYKIVSEFMSLRDPGLTRDSSPATPREPNNRGVRSRGPRKEKVQHDPFPLEGPDRASFWPESHGTVQGSK